MNTEYLDLQSCLQRASQFHGDLCAGLTLGTRMAILGLKAIGIEDPLGEDQKKIVVYAEIDRCATDALLAITGCHPGKRSLKILDYGKMAATFVNLATGKAFRVAFKEKNTVRDKAGEDSLVETYTAMPAEELFDIEEVVVDLRPEDLPGRPRHVAKCSKCGEKILDGREVNMNGTTWCIPCSRGVTYWKKK